VEKGHAIEVTNSEEGTGGEGEEWEKKKDGSGKATRTESKRLKIKKEKKEGVRSVTEVIRREVLLSALRLGKKKKRKEYFRSLSLVKGKMQTH